MTATLTTTAYSHHRDPYQQPGRRMTPADPDTIRAIRARKDRP